MSSRRHANIPAVTTEQIEGLIDVVVQAARGTPCVRRCAADMEIALRIADRLDPLIALPEPWDTAADAVVVAVVMCALAAMRRFATRSARTAAVARDLGAVAEARRRT